MLLFTVGTTFLYFEQTDVIGRYFFTRDSRTQVLAKLEFAAQSITVLTQLFLTGRIIRWIGLAATLALMPALSIIGFGALGLSASHPATLLTIFVAFAVLRRSSNWSLTNPAMEVLFTVVSREDKFKAKSLIETFVYRAGDQIGAWSYAGLAAVGLGLSGIAWVAVPLCGIFLLLGVWLGRAEESLASEATASSGNLRGKSAPRSDDVYSLRT
jgi:AAA family ATP:ADP antiporter